MTKMTGDFSESIERSEPTVSPHDNAAVAEFIDNNDLLLMGMTGVGKTTFVNHLAREVPLRYISLGEITRSAVEYNTDDRIAELMQRGGTWPLDTIVGLVRPYLDIPTPYVLDGVPKHEDEADWLARHISGRPVPTTALLLRATNNKIDERLTRRSSQERPETPEQIADRISTFSKKYEKLMTILKPELDRLVEIDTTMHTPQEVVAQFGKKVAR